MQPISRIALCGAAITLQLGGCAPAASEVPTNLEASEAGADATQPTGVMSRFSATDLEGNTLDQAMLEGKKLTMVNVWATYCTPCIGEMPALGELAQEYADKDVQIVGLVTDVLDSDGSVSDTQLATARDIVAETGASYTHIIPSPDLYHILAQVTAVPTTFFVDETGAQVGSAIVSALSKDSWTQTIDAMLAEVEA